jgi:hypothetical protein
MKKRDTTILPASLGIRAKSALTTLILLFTACCAKAQTNEYDKAVAKFTGEHKYDIEKPGALESVTALIFQGKH